ncbi:Fasciclin-like arabinogalactan protein [Melia azedarach]|uniref:Fasciclin-like arabinogalactan protein n=1 Tax=Melia azedarach TaxID=155640 RepID=A0ACC1X8L5_MELAZ|nr:Fasciclin-like arabinogalactan protein [Melia azedarach]
MDFKASFLLVLAAFSLFFYSVNSIDITERLNNYPDLIAFNDLLTQTKLAETVNRRRTITVLAVDNSSISVLNGREMDEITRILSSHVILDYYDIKKLKKTKKNSTVTTLYQTTGNADGKQGYLTVSHLPGNEFVFGSAAKDGVPVAKLVKSVYAQPFNVSILQVSQPIVAPGLGEVILPPPPPPYTPPPAMPPKMSKSRGAAPPSEVGDDEEFAPSESPIESPEEAPAPAPAPVESPAKSPPAPAKDEGATPSAVSRLYAGSGVAVVALMALVLNFVGF